MSSSKISFTSFSNIVNGKQRGANSQHQGVNPSTGEKLWDVPIATQSDVDDAVACAENAYISWSQTDMEHRRQLLRKWVDLYLSHKDDFVELMTKETGKPVGSSADAQKQRQHCLIQSSSDNSPRPKSWASKPSCPTLPRSNCPRRG